MPYSQGWKPSSDNGTRIRDRLRLVRIARYGEYGVSSLAEELGLPARTWENYERGIVMPGDVMLKFLTLTGTNPEWLLTGSGSRYTLTHAN